MKLWVGFLKRGSCITTTWIAWWWCPPRKLHGRVFICDTELLHTFRYTSNHRWLWWWRSISPRMLYVIPGGRPSYAGSGIITAVAQVCNSFVLRVQLLVDGLDRLALFVGGGGNRKRKRLNDFAQLAKILAYDFS